MLRPVILSGGAGTRLWPISTKDLPKQFLPLVEERTMIAATVGRLAGLQSERPIVVGSAAHEGLILRDVPNAKLILEPAGRNTAPAIAAAAMYTKPDDVLVVLPSDHVIVDEQAFRAAVETAAKAAADGALVTFGIVPDSPSTGYGYIRPGEKRGKGVKAVAEFVEKPDLATAERYVADGYLWNSGMFVFTAARFLEELEAQRPKMHKAVRKAFSDGVIDPEKWEGVPSESVDYAVMEGTADAVVVPLDAGWNDVGSWDSLASLRPGDEHGNVLIGEVAAQGTSGSYIRTAGPAIAVAGVSDLIVVATDEAVVVVPRGESQRVKDLLAELESKGI